MTQLHSEMQEEGGSDIVDDEGEDEPQEDEDEDQQDIDDEEIEPEDISNQMGGDKKRKKRMKKVLKKVRRRRSIIEQTHDLKELLNKIFQMRGGWVVGNLAMDFSDGFLF